MNWIHWQCSKHFLEAESYLCLKYCFSALQFCESHKIEDEHFWIHKENDDVSTKKYQTWEFTLILNSHLIKKVIINWNNALSWVNVCLIKNHENKLLKLFKVKAHH